MAKPIFIIRTNYVREVLDLLHSNDQKVEELKYDYHVLVVNKFDADTLEFEVLNTINATDIELEELKERVLTQLNEKKNVEQS